MPRIREWTNRRLASEMSRLSKHQCRCQQPHAVSRLAADEIRFGIRFPVSREQFDQIMAERETKPS